LGKLQLEIEAYHDVLELMERFGGSSMEDRRKYEVVDGALLYLGLLKLQARCDARLDLAWMDV